MQEIKNYIPISRRLFEHRFWCEERQFSQFEAWFYLLKEARFEDTKQYTGNQVIIVKRGQICVSLRYLSTAWGWSVKRVRGFLELLVTDEMITKGTPKGTAQTVITICNYDIYNFKTEQKGTTKGTTGAQQGHSKGTKYNKDIINKKKEEEYRESAQMRTPPEAPKTISDLDFRKKIFMNECAAWVETYPKEMLRDFFEYWTEPNKSGSKMRFELEKTWDLSRRLRTWENNDLKFNKNGSNKKHGGNPNHTDEELAQSVAKGIARGMAEREERLKEERERRTQH